MPSMIRKRSLYGSAAGKRMGRSGNYLFELERLNRVGRRGALIGQRAQSPYMSSSRPQDRPALRLAFFLGSSFLFSGWVRKLTEPQPGDPVPIPGRDRRPQIGALVKCHCGSRAAGSAAPAAGGTILRRLAPPPPLNPAIREHFFSPAAASPFPGRRGRKKMRTTTQRPYTEHTR